MNLVPELAMSAIILIITTTVKEENNMKIPFSDYLKFFKKFPLPHHTRSQTIYAGVNGRLSGGSSVHRPGSEDPYQPVGIGPSSLHALSWN